MNDYNTFSCHTIELRQKLSPSEWQVAFKVNLTKEHIPESYKSKGYEYFYWNFLREKGVRIYFYRPIRKKEFFEMGIKLVINPRILIGDKDYIGIFEPTEYNIERLFEGLAKIPYELKLDKVFHYEWFNNVGNILNFRIHQIDFCINHKFESPYIADTYIKLLKRGNKTKNMAEDSYFDNNCNKFKKYKNFVGFKGKSFEIAAYNKQEQLLDHKKYFPEECIDEADGIVRFEIKVKREKIRRMLKSSDNIYVSELEKMFNNIGYTSQCEFSRYIKILFGKGDYYTMEKAVEIIRRNVKEKYHKDMINFLSLVSEKRSLWKAKAELTDTNRLDKILKQFKNVKLNPVTVPIRWVNYDRNISFKNVFDILEL